MRRAALAQVQLDRVRLPRSGVVAHDDEVDGEAAEDPLRGQPPADDLGRLADQSRVRGVRRERAADVALATGTAEQLVVGGQELDAPVGQDPELHARAAQLGARDPLLDDAAVAGEAVPVLVPREGRRLELELGRHARPTSSRRPAPTPRRSTVALPLPATPSFSLTIIDCRARAPGQHRRDGVDDRPPGRGAPRRPAGAGRPPRRRADGIRTWCRDRTAAGPSRTSGCRGSGRGPARGPSCCTAIRWQRSRLGMPAPMRRAASAARGASR